MIRSRWIWLVIVVCIAAAAYKIFLMQTATQAVERAKAQNDAQRPLPVMAVAARKADMDVNLRGLGTVIPVNTVTVRSQVSGQLLRVHFKEGQIVKAGTLLAEIDPRPFEVQLMQAEGQLARDEALLRNAESDLVRYKLLLVAGFHRRSAGDHPGIAGAAIQGGCKNRPGADRQRKTATHLFASYCTGIGAYRFATGGPGKHDSIERCERNGGDNADSNRSPSYFQYRRIICPPS